MSKGKFISKLETGVIVTIISVLVWLYAEGENVLEYNNQRMQVRFVPPPGQELAVTPQEAIPILVSIRASAGEMGWLKEQIRQGPIEIEVQPDSDQDSPHQTVLLETALAETELGRLGINITGTDPKTRTVRVEPLVTRKVSIEAAPTDVQFAERPTFRPREVTVTLPESLAALAEEASIIGRIDALNLSAYEVNTDVVATVPLELPDGLQVPWTTLSQSTAQVTFNIRKLTDSVVIPRMPIRISVDPLSLEQFDVVLNQSDIVLRDVRLTGPSDVIQSIREEEVRVWAELRPTNDELQRGVSSLTPVIVAPQDVTHQPPDPIPVTIRAK